MVNCLSRYLSHLTEAIHPLQNLLKKDVPWSWSYSQEHAFQTVQKMINSPILAFYDPKKTHNSERRKRLRAVDHEPTYTPPHPPGEGGGILPHGNFWVPWPSKYTVQVVCKWAVAVCVCGAGSNKCTIWNSKLRWPCLLATHLLWQKRPFPYIVLLFEQFNML